MTDTEQPDTPVEMERAATSAPIGVSSRQIFAIAMTLLAFYAVAGIGVIWKGTEAERTAFEQSTINLALLAAGFYLGSSASARNKDHRP